MKFKKHLRHAFLGLFWISAYALCPAQHGLPKLTKQDGLPGNHVTAFSEDPAGGIWIATNSGIAVLTDGKLRQVTDTTKTTALLLDSKKRMWVGTNKGVTMWDGENWNRFAGQEGAPTRRVDVLFEDSHGAIWTGGRGGVSRYLSNEWQHFSKEDGLGHKCTFSIAEDSTGEVYLGHFGGVVTTYGLDASFSVNRYGSAAYLTWLGMGILAAGGVYTAIVFPVLALNYWPLPLIPIGLPAQLRTQVAFDKEGNFWLGNSSKFLMKNPDSEKIRFKRGKYKGGPLIYDLLPDSQGNLWLGTSRGGSVYNGNSWVTFQKGMPIFSIFEDTQGRIWFATRHGALSK